MKIKLVFDDWTKLGKSIYNTEKGIELSSGDFHSGTTFNGTIELDQEQYEELKQTLKDGYNPTFWVMEAPMMEPSLLDVLTWREWTQLAGLSTVFLLSLYVIGQFVKIVRK